MIARDREFSSTHFIRRLRPGLERAKCNGFLRGRCLLYMKKNTLKEKNYGTCDRFVISLLEMSTAAL